MTIDTERIEREFTRHIRAETITDPMELARYPDFDEEPMPLDVWLKDSAMLALPPLSEIQLDTVLHAERILYEPTFDALGWEKKRPVFDIRLAWGKGSGKDYLSRIMLSRGIYILSCLASPQGYFGMPGSETISLTNIATSAPQAQHVFFNPWVKMLGQSRYYREIMEPKANYIIFDKGLVARSGHSSVESQEGQNLIMAVIDEIAGFKTAAELSAKRKQMDREPAQSAEGVFRMAGSSIRSRFPQTGKLISISFTRFKNDMIDQLVKRAALEYEQIGEESDKYGSRAATWEVNPLRKQEDFANDYRDDSADAQCRYECRPLSSPHRFFKNLIAVRRSMGVPLAVPAEEIDKMLPVQSVGIEYFYGRDAANPEAPDAWQVKFDFSALEHHRQSLAIHMDLGISHDQAGVAATHFDGYKEHREDFADPKTGLVETKITKKVQLKTDFAIAFTQVKGDPLLGTPDSDIQVRWIRQLVIEMKNRGWVIGLFTADGYQSTDTFQLLNQEGIDTELYSLDRKTEGYDTLKNLIYGGDITVPFHPVLFGEIESLVKMTETKIDHQAGMSKDMADGWAGSARGAIKMIEDGKIGGEMDGWSGMSVDEIVGGVTDTIRSTDVDVRVKPRYAPEEHGDFWAGGGINWDKR